MPVAIPINASARVRLLAQAHPYLTPADIAATTGIPLPNVKAALKKSERLVRPKSRRR